MTKAERLNFYADLAAARHGCTRTDVLGRKRRHYEARREVMCRLYATGWSSPQIGEAMGRDHTSILHGLGRLSR